MIGFGQVSISNSQFNGIDYVLIAKIAHFIKIAIWLLPTHWKYGGWPRSGEVDLFEARSNIKYGNDVQIGVEQVASRIHYGPNWNKKASQGYERNNAAGFHSAFHKYEYIWDESGVRFRLDGNEIGHVPVADGFWKRGGFDGENIWASATKMAPFDQEVRIRILKLKIKKCFQIRILLLAVPFHHQFGCRWYLLPGCE